jgi:hypothetical protein
MAWSDGPTDVTEDPVAMMLDYVDGECDDTWLGVVLERLRVFGRQLDDPIALRMSLGDLEPTRFTDSLDLACWKHDHGQLKIDAVTWLLDVGAPWAGALARDTISVACREAIYRHPRYRSSQLAQQAQQVRPGRAGVATGDKPSL